MDNNEYIQSVNEYSDLIYRVALHACGNQMDAEDMVQEAYGAKCIYQIISA